MDIKNKVDTVLSFYENMTSSGISKNKAQSMKISHCDPALRGRTMLWIKEHVGNGKGISAPYKKETHGVYIYHDADKVYYVGKAKPLYGRLLCHFDESVFDEELSKNAGLKVKGGDKLKGLYPAFFRDHLKDVALTITWVEIEDEDLRVSVEALLTHNLKPTFKEFQKNTTN